MNYIRLQAAFRDRAWFTARDVADALKIAPLSALVACSRYVKQGLLVRLKKNYYVLAERWNRLSANELFPVANILQVPSYVSLMSALSFHGRTTQVQRNVIESVCVKKSRMFSIRQAEFRFFKITERYYSGFARDEGIFMATPEKALVDAVYLQSLGKYRLDADSVDFAGFDKNRLKRIVRVFPDKTQRMVRSICGI